MSEREEKESEKERGGEREVYMWRDRESEKLIKTNRKRCWVMKREKGS